MSADRPAGATDFAHMLLKVSDLERSQRFYVDLLGFTLRPVPVAASFRGIRWGPEPGDLAALATAAHYRAWR